ncbi:nuclear pore complex protein NUP62 [Helianthus annuus]|uniref:nuclear pore complex protein NUP62 n=1 Tax=Helianthus annuus TaxID=4232 RepID=UPI000B8FF0AD|nr:nuclear pore complex protein NUP62 [Helianthus annuus]
MADFSFNTNPSTFSFVSSSSSSSSSSTNTAFGSSSTKTTTQHTSSSTLGFSSSSFSFGNVTTSSSVTSPTTTPSPAVASTGTSTSFSFQTSSTTLATLALSSQPLSTPSASLLSTTASTTTTSTATATTAQTSSPLVVSSSSGTTTSVSTTAVSAPKIPSEITGKTVEEIIKEWNVELQEQTSKFRKLANAIAEWDKRILNNRDVLLKLEAEVAKVVETQSNLERQLELIETHQQEADKSLRSVEEEAERIYKDEHGLLLDDEAASTRDTMYEQAEFIEREMEQMTEQIKSVIQKLNANQGGELETTDGMSPVDVVVRILNNQLSSLVWIDEKAEEFSSHIQNLAKKGTTADQALMGLKFWLS